MSNRFPENLYFSGDGRELLKCLTGQKIVRMFHYYLGNHKEFQEDLHNLSVRFPQDQIFSMIAGPLLIEFDSGIEISFFAEEPMLSIAFWLERNNNGKYIDLGSFCKPLDYQDRSFIDVNSIEFSNNVMRAFLGKKITTIKLYRKDGLISNSAYYIKDSVISFVFENSSSMAIGFDILDVPPVMSVVPWDLIPANMRDNLFEVSVI
jgi:hypothetical protein